MYIDELINWNDTIEDTFTKNVENIKVKNFNNEMVNITSYYNNGIKPVFQIKLLNNMILECTGNEKLLVFNDKTDIAEWKNVSEIESGDLIQLKKC